ncbi:hypothetical protein [Paenibacillus azoreducens]|uniref:SurA N-terminal domain-containing protein n=1 Tax=Paenibacillus azoreducens TaxID=116718 RepID=A0A920CSR4_9BACL|nr:hypothetical protein [Paenibacillus azoreducens]GIO48429.1 hypothetical protein J34TS1_31940 [Paenibacillus azoreducens]
MKLNKLTVIAGGVCLSLFLIGFAFSASASNAANPSTDKVDTIRSSFNDLKAKLDPDQNHQNSAVPVPLVQGEDFQISKQEFIFYKSNLELINKLQNHQISISDDALIDNMVKKKLTVSYAKNLGLKVTPEEVDAVIERERSSLSDSSIKGRNNETVRELMKQRIRITGLSEDEFWNSDQTKKEYEKALLIGKLFDKLAAEGKIGKEGADFESFQKNLLESSVGKLTINKNVLKP